ncbi:uncharacterized protein PADG_00657 [Paracoccidioides brasiliensis Pb18]|uniref:Uncharacterized protein n=1 Tax=Paracoccidioides brasiliensis (strain Pb18) TaxID=502780 RepID=C1G1B7_PARBD|nr:uncharacterized protein PADG_00657 [Paracoccidioides brasiliensis Pb18]EEH44368.2 hypothetical protein PADG_00657 [Paracoccidioides brasiliensis Pb18]
MAIVVRKSRSSWSDSLQPLVWIREDDETIKTKILSAVTPQRLLKTGYLLIDADWDLDFTAMVKAHELVGQDRLKFDDFKTAVLVHGGGADGMDWLVWKVEEEKSDASSSEEKLSDSQRDKIVMFQEKLAAMGKEDLFFRWVELIQYESTQPGGFTPERQRKAMQETKQLFEEQGVDFEKFWADSEGKKRAGRLAGLAGSLSGWLWLALRQNWARPGQGGKERGKSAGKQTSRTSRTVI